MLKRFLRRYIVLSIFLLGPFVIWSWKNKNLFNYSPSEAGRSQAHKTKSEQQKIIEQYKSRLNAREEAMKEIAMHKEENPGRKQLPRVILIGVKKCGTDGIVSFLGYHPLIKIPIEVQSETFFFNGKGYSAGAAKYISFFPPTNDIEWGMEKTPAYFDSPPFDFPSRIKDMVPNAKLLLIVCDPTKRAFSDYVHERMRHDLVNDTMIAEYKTFDDYVDHYLPILEKLMMNTTSNFTTNPSSDLRTQKMLTALPHKDSAATLISTGLYVYHIHRWKRLYNQSNFLTIDGEDFMANTGKVMEKIQDFLKIPKLLWKEDFVKNPDTGFYCHRKLTEQHLNQSRVETNNELIASLQCLAKTKGRTRNGAKTASSKTLEELRKFYQPFNKDFYREMNHQYNWM
ncbi:unnamed protein product [Clavelina lepadiformis]|uniref:Sulfotransferase n=1 Tax=Clavelina lepadiformis TaxID=159417 RepID=A0ABP0GIA9_CLALP